VRKDTFFSASDMGICHPERSRSLTPQISPTTFSISQEAFPTQADKTFPRNAATLRQKEQMAL
jgi:hypothetical protein